MSSCTLPPASPGPRPPPAPGLPQSPKINFYYLVWQFDSKCIFVMFHKINLHSEKLKKQSLVRLTRFSKYVICTWQDAVVDGGGSLDGVHGEGEKMPTEDVEDIFVQRHRQRQQRGRHHVRQRVDVLSLQKWNLQEQVLENHFNIYLLSF